MKSIILIISLGFAIQCSLKAQKPTKKVIDQTVNTIANQVKENYVLPAKGELIAEHFLQDLKNGRFYQAQSLKQLDSIMTKSLREGSNNDFHLYSWNNKEIVQQLRTSASNEEENSTDFFNDKAAYNSNFGFERVEILPENIGYIKLSQINISEYSLKKLYAVMNLVENTNALIIDLRDNSGGGSTVGSVLESYFFREHTDLLEFRSRNGKTEMNSTVGWLLEKRYLKPLYLLVNKSTASAAEAFAFALKSHDRCTIVGRPTSGGAYMNTYFPVNHDFVVAISTSAPFLPGTTDSWEGTGIQPHHLVDSKDALSRTLEIVKK